MGRFFARPFPQLAPQVFFDQVEVDLTDQRQQTMRQSIRSCSSNCEMDTSDAPGLLPNDSTDP